MKLILSRKGFDSGYGGCASPIFPNDSMASFPIPDRHEKWDSLHGMFCGDYDLGAVAQDLTRGLSPSHSIERGSMIHLDPDLRVRHPLGLDGWRTAFGQDGAAQTHLSNQLVGSGDIFLFFGWFRRVQQFEKRWRFDPKEPDLHVIFGWLQVDQVIQVSEYRKRRSTYPWLEHHPHIRNAIRYPGNNTIYVAADRLFIGGQPTAQPGGGAFGCFSSIRQLTHPAQPVPVKRSVWQLPRWFSAENASGKRALTYHGNENRWTFNVKDPTRVELRSVAKGQEFVFDMERTGKASANKWFKALFEGRL